MNDGAITLWDVKKILEGGPPAGGEGSEQQLRMGKGCVSAANIHNGVPVNSV